ncbi:MAG: ABC transporter substrate-binding protein [Sphingomonadaceae bacterium]
MPKLISAIAIVLTLLLASACGQQAATQPRAMVYGTTNQPNTLNPITAPDIVSRSMIEMIFDGLVAADDSFKIRGELATEWQTSADGTEWTFHLRKGVKWHDGKDFTADDVKFTYDTVINPNTKPTVSKADYAAIQRVEVVDPHTVRFRLSRPDAAFLSRLVLGIAPKHLLEGQDLATAAFNSQPVGTGPFIFESWSKGESVTLKRNPNYFGTVPKMEKIVWKIVPDSSMLAVQAMNGEVDAAPVFGPSDAATFKSSSKMTLHEALEGNTQVSLRLTNPLFQDVRVRRALAHAIDTQSLIDKVMLGAAVPATSDIPPTSWAYNPNVPRYDYDPAKAKALLAEAGWTPGPDGILTKDGRRFQFSIMTYAGNKTQEQVMMAIRQNWADLGMEVKAGVQERNSFVAQTVLKGNFDAALLQSAVQLDPDISRRFHTNSIQNGQNFLNYSNKAVDELLAQGLATNDREKRRQAYAEVQRILAEDLPQISLFHPKTVYAFKPQIQGVKPSSTNLFWNAEEWEWK